MKQKKKREDRYNDKCVKYTERDDLPRLKSYLRKHDININEVRASNDDSLLHLCCRLGHDRIMRYLLKKGMRTRYRNQDGKLAIHLAVDLAVAGEKYAYTDIILPLIQKDPDCLDIMDPEGTTPRKLLNDWRKSTVITISGSDSSSSSSSSSDSDSESTHSREPPTHQGEPPVDDDASWARRMAEEMNDEFFEEHGQFEQDYYRKMKDEETWDEWASRINEEHRTKASHAHYRPPPSRKAKRPAEPPLRPRISEEKRRRFLEKEREETERRKQELSEIRRAMHDVNIQVYEVLCAALYGAAKPDTADHMTNSLANHRAECLRRRVSQLRDQSCRLHHHHIPWPVALDTKLQAKTDIQEKNILEFLFSGCTSGSATYAERLKKEQRRWHPDRFLQKCGGRLYEKHKDKIVDSVTKVSQVLNTLSQK